jgi:predicted DNA-binding protein (MmcQ/YjbR family)
MLLEELREYCLRKIAVTEEFPFDDRTLVFKVAGKMFALTDIMDFQSVNLKCDPEQAIAWREEYQAVLPGYHMNKKHWNTVFLNQDVSDRLMYEMIDHSYQQVVSKLPKRLKNELALG